MSGQSSESDVDSDIEYYWSDREDTIENPQDSNSNQNQRIGQSNIINNNNNIDIKLEENNELNKILTENEVIQKQESQKIVYKNRFNLSKTKLISKFNNLRTSRVSFADKNDSSSKKSSGLIELKIKQNKKKKNKKVNSK